MNNNPEMTQTGDFYAVYKSSNITVPFQHYHDSYEICFFLNASLQIFLRDKKYDISDGDIVFVNEYDIHKYIYNDCTVYNRYVINFKKDFILSFIKASGAGNLLDMLGSFQHAKISTSLKERNELETLFKALTLSCNTALPSVQAHLSSRGTGQNITDNIGEARTKSYLLLVLLKIYELFVAVKNEKHLNKKDKLVQSIVQFIDANFMKKISLDLLEKEFYLDKFHISHNFKDVTGFTVMEYVQYRRVIEAQKMLKKNEKEIIDICFDSGFNNIQHFYRVFKKISGSTPAKFRKLET